MCAARRELGGLGAVERRPPAASGIFLDVPRLSSTRILSRSGLRAITLSVSARAASAVVAVTIGPATKTRARAGGAVACSARSAKRVGLVVAEREHRGHAVGGVGAQLAFEVGAGVQLGRRAQVLDRRQVPVGVDEAGHQRLALQLDAGRARRGRGPRRPGRPRRSCRRGRRPCRCSMTLPVPSMTRPLTKAVTCASAGRQNPNTTSAATNAVRAMAAILAASSRRAAARRASGARPRHQRLGSGGRRAAAAVRRSGPGSPSRGACGRCSRTPCSAPCRRSAVPAPRGGRSGRAPRRCRCRNWGRGRRGHSDC